MGNIPLKWGLIGTDGKVEINGADDSAFSSSSPAFKVNGDGTVTGSFSIGGSLTVSGNESLTGNLTIGGNAIFSGSHHIDYTGTKATYAMIKFKDNTADTSGNGIIIGGGGLTAIGGGESVDTMTASLGGNDEKLLLCNDGDIDFYTNCQNGAATAVHTYIDTNGIFQGAVKSVYGIYTANGGQQGPSYFGKNRAGFLMSNASVAGDSHYKNWLYMDNYNGTDVGGATAIGVDRTEPRMFIMQSDANRTTWNNTAAVGVFTATPTSGGAVVADGTTGGIKTITDNITGSGTTNYIPKFTGAHTITDGFGTTTSVTSGSRSLVTSGGVYTALSDKIKRTASNRNFTSKTSMAYTGLSLTCPSGHVYLVQAWFRYNNGAPRYVAACHSSTTYAFYDCVAASTDTGTTNAGHSSLSFILTPGETIYYWAMYYSVTANFISETIVDITL